eukprot:gene11551-15471_t
MSSNSNSNSSNSFQTYKLAREYDNYCNGDIYPTNFIKLTSHSTLHIQNELSVSKWLLKLIKQTESNERKRELNSDNRLINYLLNEANIIKRENKLRSFITSQINLNFSNDSSPSFNNIDNNNLILLMFVSKGYLFLFLNFICSLHAYNLNHVSIINSLIVLVIEEETQEILIKLGFHVINLQESYTPYTVKEFNNQYHGDKILLIAKTLSFAVMSDILGIGYDFFFTDVDVVWHKDIRFYLTKAKDNLDFLMLSDGRKNDIEGPFSGGVLLGRSTCRSKVAMNTLIANMDLIDTYRLTDQAIMNLIFFHAKKLRLLRIDILPPKLFINGHIYSTQRNVMVSGGSTIADINWDKVLLVHSSWTLGIGGKIYKLKQSNDWFYHSRSNCPLYYKEIDLPLALNLKGYYENERANRSNLGYYFNRLSSFAKSVFTLVHS